MHTLPSLQAQDRFDKWIDGEIRLHPNEVYRVVLEATDDEEEAQRYFNAAVRANLRSP